MNDDYAGRLILSLDQGGGQGNFTALRVARLSLPALLRSAKFIPRDGDSTCSRWEEVALGNITGATIAEWMMQAGQESMAQQLGGQKARLSFEVTDFAISAGQSELSKAEQGSQLIWHAITSVVPITN